MKPVQKIWLALFSLWAYAGWFFCVFAGKLELEALALLGPVITWLLFMGAFRPEMSMRLQLIALSAFGLAFDSAALRLHWIALPSGSLEPSLWLISLWLHFTPSLLLLKAVFHNRLLLGALAGAVLGPLSYKSGEAFQVLRFSDPIAPYLYAAFWAGFLPGAIFWLKNRKKEVDANS